MEELQKVPGIGPYTAGAIASICFGVRTPAVDGNVLRVLSRITGVATHVKGKYAGPFSQKLAEELYADGVCPAEVPSGVLNQAIMELGATYCQTKGTGIDENDPLREHYLTTRLAGDIWDFLKGGGDPEELRELAAKVRIDEIRSVAATTMSRASKASASDSFSPKLQRLVRSASNQQNHFRDSLRSSSPHLSHTFTPKLRTTHPHATF